MNWIVVSARIMATKGIGLSKAELAWRLDREGWRLPAQDILISACALRIGATVFTHDKHFRVVPGLSVISSLEELEEW